MFFKHKIKYIMDLSFPNRRMRVVGRIMPGGLLVLASTSAFPQQPPTALS